MCVSFPAVAADQLRETRVLEEVIVSAQKREQSSLEVPISITAISGQELNAAGIRNATDLSFNVPGLVVGEVQPGNQVIAIRGIGSERGGSALAGIYLDDIPLSASVPPSNNSGNDSGIDLRTKDLARVEVLKGPQGTLFGEGSAGGTLRFITNDPKLDRFEGSATASFFSTEDGDASYAADGVLNLPLAEDTFAIRLVGSHENNGGWIDAVSSPVGPVIKKDINDSVTTEFRLKALWTPTEKLSIEGTVVGYDLDGGGSNIVNVEPRSKHQVVLPVSHDASQGTIDNQYQIYNASVTYDLGFAQLLSSTSKADIDSLMDVGYQLFTGGDLAASFIGLPAGPVSVEIAFYDAETDMSNFSQELRLTSKNADSIHWVLGAYYKDAEASSTSEGLDLLIDDVLVFDRLLRGLRDFQSSESWATYADASIELPHGFELGGGLRYFSDHRISYDPDDRANTFGSGTFTKLTYRAYISHALGEAVRLYANTSTGFRSGGLNLPSTITAGGPRTFDPETVKAYELGAKGSFFDGRVSAEIALFRNDYVDMQADSFGVFNGTPTQFTSNAGEARIEGFEAALAAQIADGWRLSLSGEVLDSEITKVDDTTAGEKLRGDPVDLVPDYQLTISTDYDFEWAAALSGRIRLSYSSQGKSHRTFRNNLSANELAFAPGVEFFNASVETSWQGWTMTLFGRNLFNEDGILRASPTGTLPQPRPRSIGITLSKTF